MTNAWVIHGIIGFGEVLVQGFVPNDFMTEPFYFFFQMQLAAPESDKYLVIRRAMEEGLIDLFFEPFKIGDMNRLFHNSLLVSCMRLLERQPGNR